VAEVRLVQIGLEDLLLRVARFDKHGQRRLSQLAHEGSLGREEAILDELLRDRATTLGHPAIGEIGPERPRESAQIEAAVLEEPVVFRSEHGVDQGLGSGGEAERAEVLPRLVAASRPPPALRRRALGVLAVAGDTRDPLTLDLEADAPSAIAEDDIPAAASPPKLPALRRYAAGLDISETAQGAGELGHAHVRSAGERLPGRVDHDGVPALESFEPPELDRRVDDHGQHEDEHESGEPQGQGGRPSVADDFHRITRNQSPCQAAAIGPPHASPNVAIPLCSPYAQKLRVGSDVRTGRTG